MLGTHPYECVCGARFLSHRELTSHQKNTFRHVICTCGEIFQTSGEVISHLDGSPGHSRLICGCGEQFDTSVDMVNHRRNSKKHKGLPSSQFWCECGTQFPSENSLNSHRKSGSKRHKAWAASHAGATSTLNVSSNGIIWPALQHLCKFTEVRDGFNTMQSHFLSAMHQLGQSVNTQEAAYAFEGAMIGFSIAAALCNMPANLYSDNGPQKAQGSIVRLPMVSNLAGMFSLSSEL